MKRIIFALLIVVSSYTCLLAQPPIGSKVPEIELPGTTGTKVKLSSLKGKVVIIDFWASWCGPCRRSMPALKAVYKKYKDKGLEIYGISLDDNNAAWDKAVKEDRTPWLHVIDREGGIARKWGIQYIPTSFLLDKEGKLIAVNTEKEELEKLLKQLLG
jgi:thiol-disulfide isomerase/thioredoxin